MFEHFAHRIIPKGWGNDYQVSLLEAAISSAPCGNGTISVALDPMQILSRQLCPAARGGRLCSFMLRA